MDELRAAPAPTVPQLRAALARTCDALADLAATLTPQQWQLPTCCPGWDVRDQVAHVASLEATLAGVPLPEQEAPQAAHVRNRMAAYMERLVDWRRTWPTEQLVAELRRACALRQEQLVALGDDPDRLVPGIFDRSLRLADLLSLRTFDCYVHEQDVRRAVGVVGQPDGHVVDVVRAAVAPMLAGVWATVAPDRGAVLVADGAPLVSQGERAEATLVMSFDDLVRLVAGRADARPQAVRFEGDEELGLRLLAASTGLTP